VYRLKYLSRKVFTTRVEDLHPLFLLGSCYSIFSFMYIFFRSFVLLSFFFWPLYCLSFFDLLILVTSLFVASNSSYIRRYAPSNNKPYSNNYIITHRQTNKPNDHGYVLLVATIIQSYSHSWLVIWFLMGETRGLLMAEYVLLTLWDYMSLLFSSLWVSYCSIFIFLCSVLQVMICPFSFEDASGSMS
jgi:hypothetical protein